MKPSKLNHHWRVKGTILSILALTPGGDVINDVLQTKFGALRSFETSMARKVDDWAGIMSLFEAAQRTSIERKTLLETGKGWHPTLPVCMLLVGAGRVHTLDPTRHLNALLTFQMRDALASHRDRIALASRQTRAAGTCSVRDRSIESSIPTAYWSMSTRRHSPFLCRGPAGFSRTTGSWYMRLPAMTTAPSSTRASRS